MARKFRKLSRRNIAIALATLLIVIAAVVYAQHRSRLNNPVIPSSNPLSNTEKSASSDSASSKQPAQSTSSSSQSTPAQSGPAPIVPYGNFVSNHHPGGDVSTSEASVCNTSAGATCYIQFTKGTVVKKLDTQTTNGNGAAIWYWDIKSAGLTQGSWTVAAVATLNGQTKTATDSLQLVVQ